MKMRGGEITITESVHFNKIRTKHGEMKWKQKDIQNEKKTRNYRKTKTKTPFMNTKQDNCKKEIYKRNQKTTSKKRTKQG